MTAQNASAEPGFATTGNIRGRVRFDTCIASLVRPIRWATPLISKSSCADSEPRSADFATYISTNTAFSITGRLKGVEAVETVTPVGLRSTDE